MGVIGTSAGGYATVLPTQGNPIGEAMSNVENSAFRYSAQKMAKDKMKQDAERDLYDRRRQEIEYANQFRKDNPFVDTMTGIDGSNRQSYDNGKKSANYFYNQYLKTGSDQDLASYEEAVKSVNAISQMPKMLNSVRESWNENADQLNQRSLKNKMSITDKLNNGQIVQTNNEKGQGRWTVFDKDENGKISKVVKENMNPTELQNMLKVVPLFNIDDASNKKNTSFVEDFKTAVNANKTRETTNTVNGIETKKEFVPNAEIVAKRMAEEAVQDRDKLYNVFDRIGIDPEDDNSYKDTNIDKAKAYLEKVLIDSVPTTVSEKPDSEGQKLALQKAEFAYKKKRDIIEDSKTTDAPKAIPLTVTRYAGTGIDPETGSEQEAGVFKIGITPVKGSPVKAITHNPKTGVTTAYILDTKSNFLTQSGKDKIASGEDKTLIDSDYINSEFKTRPVSSEKNSGHFNRIIRTEITKDGKNGYNDYSDFYRSFSPAIKEAKTSTPKAKAKTKEAAPKKTINRSDIESKAKASGYSPKEYEALLIKKGVTIN